MAVVLFICAAALFGFERKNILPESTAPAGSPVPQVRGRNNPDSVEWNLYRNKDFQYEIVYPKTWEVLEAKKTPDSSGMSQKVLFGQEQQKVTFMEKDSAFWPGEFQIRIILNPEKLALEEWLDKNEPKDVEEGSLVQQASDTTIGGKQARWLSVFNFDSEGIDFALSHKGNIFYIQFTGNNPNDPDQKRHWLIYQKMIKSFKITD